MQTSLPKQNNQYATWPYITAYFVTTNILQNQAECIRVQWHSNS